MNIFSKFKQILVNAFYPKHIKCIYCRDEIYIKNPLDMCENCCKTLPFITKNFCNRCGSQFEKDGAGVCLNCKSSNFSFTLARSALNFDGEVVSAIHKFKYAKYKFLAQPFACLLHNTLVKQNWNVDIICYVPLFEKREKERGYNQSRELAYQLSKLINTPIFNDIVRIRDTPTQTHLSRKERKKNVKDSFKITNKSLIKNLNILLIDDVFTTGSTSNEVSKELKSAGANNIYVLTIAHAGFKQKF